MIKKQVFLFSALITGLAFLPTGSALAEKAKTLDVYNATEKMIKARQMGLNITGQERTYQDAISSFCRQGSANSAELIAQTVKSLDYKIAAKRRNYDKKFVTAHDVAPEMEQNGAVKIWTLMDSVKGDFEWTKAVKEVLVGAGITWSPQTNSAELGIFVINGQGTITIEGQQAKIFREDIVAVPPNMRFSIKSKGHSPIRFVVSEAFPDITGKELGSLEPGVTWTYPWLKPKTPTGTSKQATQTVLDDLTALMKTTKAMGIMTVDEANQNFLLAKQCLTGGNYDASYTFAHIAKDWLERAIKELQEDKKSLAANGVKVANKMTSEAPLFHNETIPAYISAMELPFKYHEFVLPFEVLAKNRLGPHQHNTEELYYILNGRGRMMVAGPTGSRYFKKDQPGIEVNSGTLIFIPSMSQHSLYPVGFSSLVHAIAIGTYIDKKRYAKDIKMDVPSSPWTPKSWKNAYPPEK